MSTPILPLAVWMSGTNQNSIPANDNALRIEALNREIISQSVTSQPGTPTDGDTYIIASTHTGSQWGGFTPKDIAIFKTGTWYAWAPTEGLIVNVAGDQYKYDGAAWVAAGSGGGGAVASVNGQTGIVVLDTDDVSEGGTNQYLTAERVQDIVGGFVVAGTNMTITYNDVGNTLTFDASGGGGGGGLTNWTEAISISAPNASTPVASFTATNAATNIDAVLKSKGNGALAAQVADNSTTGGNKRGNYAVDWQMSRTSSDCVASNQYCVIGGGTDNKASGAISTVAGGYTNTASGITSFVGGGQYNTASGTSSAIAGGDGNTTGGTYSFATGQNNNVSGNGSGGFGGSNTVSGIYCLAIGQSNTANSQNCFVHGNQGHSRGLIGASVHSVSSHNARGDLQSLAIVLRASTSNATPSVLTTDASSAGSTNQFVLQDNQSATVIGKVVARDGTTGDTKSWTFAASVKRGSGAAATSMVAACTPVVVAADTSTSSWALAVSADTTNGALSIVFTGAASTAIRVGCHLVDIECTF